MRSLNVAKAFTTEQRKQALIFPKRRSNGKIVGNGARDVPIAAKSGLIGKICNFAEKGVATERVDISPRGEMEHSAVCDDVRADVSEQSETKLSESCFDDG